MNSYLTHIVKQNGNSWLVYKKYWIKNLTGLSWLTFFEVFLSLIKWTLWQYLEKGYDHILPNSYLLTYWFAFLLYQRELSTVNLFLWTKPFIYKCTAVNIPNLKVEDHIFLWICEFYILIMHLTTQHFYWSHFWYKKKWYQCWNIQGTPLTWHHVTLRS